jgi:hypothetical protein
MHNKQKVWPHAEYFPTVFNYKTIAFSLIKLIVTQPNTRTNAQSMHACVHKKSLINEEGSVMHTKQWSMMVRMAERLILEEIE